METSVAVFVVISHRFIPDGVRAGLKTSAPTYGTSPQVSVLFGTKAGRAESPQLNDAK
jgi:hypothetical protein